MEKNKKIMDIQSLIFTVATLFLLLIAGIIAGKLKIVDEIASKKLSRLILTIGQPMLIISSVLTAPIPTKIYNRIKSYGRLLHCAR